MEDHEREGIHHSSIQKESAMKVKGWHVKWGIFGAIIVGVLLLFKVVLKGGKWKPLSRGVAEARLPEPADASREELAHIVKEREKIAKEIERNAKELEADAVIDRFNNAFGRDGRSR